MRKIIESLLIISFFFIVPLCYSQNAVKVSDPRLEMNGHIITISYDILNSSPDENYIISLEIKDENGNIIDARSLDGDIGDGVSGGSNKQITWNLDSDKIYIDAHIYVQIYAKIVTHSPSSKTNPESYERTGLILQSIAFPGLGLSRLTGNPHWIRGVAGYGCIIGSIVLNGQASKTYNSIEDLIYFDDINSAYDKSIQQSNISNILAFAAVGIWVTDIIWTLVGTSDLKDSPYSADSNGFSLGGTFDPISNAPMVSVRYRFKTQ